MGSRLMRDGTCRWKSGSHSSSSPTRHTRWACGLAADYQIDAFDCAFGELGRRGHDPARVVGIGEHALHERDRDAAAPRIQRATTPVTGARIRVESGMHERESGG